MMAKRVRFELTHELPRYYQLSRLAPYLLGLPLHTVLSAFHRVETIGALDLAARIKQLLFLASNYFFTLKD